MALGVLSGGHVLLSHISHPSCLAFSPKHLETPDPTGSKKAVVKLAGLTLSLNFICGAGPWALLVGN